MEESTLNLCKTCAYRYPTNDGRVMCVRPLDHEEDNWEPIVRERADVHGCGINGKYWRARDGQVLRDVASVR